MACQLVNSNEYTEWKLGIYLKKKVHKSNVLLLLNCDALQASFVRKTLLFNIYVSVINQFICY